MGAGHDHGHGTSNQRAMKLALLLTTTFLVVEQGQLDGTRRERPGHGRRNSDTPTCQGTAY